MALCVDAGKYEEVSVVVEDRRTQNVQSEFSQEMVKQRKNGATVVRWSLYIYLRYLL